MSAFDKAATATDEEIKEDDEGGSYVDRLVKAKGEKWKDPETIARGKVEADNFIEQLKRQNEELRADLEKSSKLDELLQLVKSQKQSPVDGGDSNPPLEKKSDTSSGGPSEDDLRALIESHVSKRETETQRKKNLATVDAELDKRFGDSAGTVLKRRANELDMTIDEVKELAANKPKAFFSLMGLDKAASTKDERLTKGTVLRTEAGGNHRGEVRDWNYYQNLRRKSRSQYHSITTQRQMMRDKEELGDAFGMPR